MVRVCHQIYTTDSEHLFLFTALKYLSVAAMIVPFLLGSVVTHVAARGAGGAAKDTRQHHVKTINVTFDNTKPRLSDTGEIVNAHDGTIRYVDGYWWLHAASYGAGGCVDPPHTGCERDASNCGFQQNHNVSIWKSETMESGTWHFVGNAVECERAPDCGILYRPHMVYNRKNRKYVLYYNYVSKAGYGSRNGVATASHPAGPWTIVEAAMKTARPMLPHSNSNGSVGDFDVLVDGDDAYMVYSYGPMSLEKLDADFINSAGVNASFPGGAFGGTVLPSVFVEAPSLWKKDGTYFLSTGHCCCFCWQGSGFIVYTAKHPLGPWTLQPSPAAAAGGGGRGGEHDMGCTANASNPTPAEQHTLPLTAIASPGQGCNYQNAVAASVSRAQQNFVFTVATASAGVVTVYTGDRWMQAPDGKKAHEPQYWQPLQFDAKTGHVLPLEWVDSFTLDMLVPQPE